MIEKESSFPNSRAVFEQSQIQPALNCISFINGYLQSQAPELIEEYFLEEESGLTVVRYPILLDSFGRKHTCTSFLDNSANLVGFDVRSIYQDYQENEVAKQISEVFLLYSLSGSDDDKWIGEGKVKVEGEKTFSKPFPSLLIPELVGNKLDKYLTLLTIKTPSFYPN